jgi:hypothetical protein
VILILDANALLWWLADDPELAGAARAAVADPATDVLVSAATIWEIEIKRALEDLPPTWSTPSRWRASTRFRSRQPTPNGRPRRHTIVTHSTACSSPRQLGSTVIVTRRVVRRYTSKCRRPD